LFPSRLQRKCGLWQAVPRGVLPGLGQRAALRLAVRSRVFGCRLEPAECWGRSLCAKCCVYASVCLNWCCPDACYI
jgi:hypothetical protein